MFKISYDKKITMVQGDTGVILMRICNYELSLGDEVRFAIVDKAKPSILLCQHSDKKVVLEKKVTVFEKDGAARIIIYPYDTENLPPGKYLYEIQVETKDGRIDTVVPLTSFTLMEGAIQGAYGQTKPLEPEPSLPGGGVTEPEPSLPGAGTNSSNVELRFERLENEIIPQLGYRITNVEKEVDSISAPLDNMASDIEELKQGRVLNVYNIKSFDEIKEIQFKDGDVINITDNLFADSTISTDKSVTINGNGHTVTCGVDGLNKIFILKGKKAIITNVNFNMNLKGRTVLEFVENDLIDVNNCTFTGYSLEYGYNANDSSILCSSVKGGKIENNLFYDNGGQYTPDVNHLNRCITLNQSNNMRVINNVFDKVSQCIIGADFNSLVIDGNTFNAFVDNGIYITSSCRGLKISNNTFSNNKDESIVFSGHNVRIVNNDFLECFTAIAFNGPVRHTVIQNNKHLRSEGYTTFIRVRPTATLGQLENVKIQGNMLDGTLDYCIIGLRDTINVSIVDNVFKVNCDGTGKFMLHTDGNHKNLIIKDNVFESVGDECLVLYNVNTGTPSGLFSYNILNNTKFKWIGGTVRIEGHRIDNLNYLYEDYTSRLTSNTSPEGNIKGAKGSILTDLSTGNVYTKTTDTSSTTGWVKLN